MNYINQILSDHGKTLMQTLMTSVIVSNVIIERKQTALSKSY